MIAAREQQYLSTCPFCDTQIDVTALEPFTKLKCLNCGEMVRVRRKFDHFVITRQIGEGGMSRVFEAEDETLGRRVALKILNRQYGRDAGRVEQFRREALITATVIHPNVIKLYSVGYDQGYFYIAMELVGGGSLDQRIRQAGKLPEPEVLRIGREVAEGLRAAERAGLIHRDVKPANILFTETGTAKVVDFGLALFAKRDVDRSGEIWATPYYVAPEKVIENREDYRSDIFSLGATMFHALTGKPPHKADTNALHELKIIKCRRVTLEDSGLRFDPHTHHVVNRMLAFKPEDRCETYDQVIEELRLAEGLSSRSLLRAGPRRMRSALLAGAAVVTAFLVGWVLRNSRERQVRSIVREPAMIEKQVTGDGVALQAGAQTTADRFIQARETLLQGKFKEAYDSFSQIILSGARQPTLNWARFNAALCAIVSERRNDALDLFKQIAVDSTAIAPSTGENLSSFFRKLGSLMGDNLGLGSDASKLTYGESNEEIMGYLALGLAEWHFGDPREGAESIARFLAGKPTEKNLEWVPRYRILVEPYLHDIQVVRGLRKGRPKSLEDAEAALAEIVKAKSSLQTSGTLTRILARSESALNKDIARFRLDAQRAEMAQAAERRKRELEQLADIIETLPALVQQYDYAPVLGVLKDIQFESPEVQAALDGQRYLYTKSQEFVQQVISDINSRGYRGRLERRESGSLEGLVSGVDGKNWQIRIERGVMSVPFESVIPETLVAMAEAFRNQVTDSTDYYRRQELIAAFARVQGMQDLSTTIATQLMEENRDFRSRWMQVLQGGI